MCVMDNPSPADRGFDDQQFDLRSSLVVKLPTFEGDLLKWAEFWELFKVSVHSNKSILLPVVKEKLPEAWRLEWARAQTASAADFSAFLDFLQREMEVREQAAAGPAKTAADSPRPSGYTATAEVATSQRTQHHHHHLSVSSHSAQETQTATDRPDASGGVCFTQTALVEVTGPRGTCMLRVLIDGGSDSSYIRTSAADLLGLPTVGSGTFACMGFQERGEEPRVYEKVRVAMRSRHGGEEHLFDLWKTDRLCSLPTPARPPAVTYQPHLLLADDYHGGPVDILIGVDQMYKVLMWKQIPLTDRLRAVETVFGYVLHGRDDAPVAPPAAKYVLRCSRLQIDCNRLWSMEALGIQVEDEERKQPPEPTWNSKENRYEMGLLWASDERPITNLTSTAARTGRMEQRLAPAQRREYSEHLTELQRVGVIETPPDDDRSGFYLPHRGIWRNGKLRVVYDGSARDAAGRSLNSYLDAGENLLRRLPVVLLNFRRDVVAAQADIRSAFHQVSVSEVDRKYLQFLWADQRLRFRRVPFGLTCSPYMLLQTITTHLAQYRTTDPLLCAKLEAGLYMDDVCISFACRDEADSSMKRTAEIFSDAGMDVHKLRISGDDTGAAAPVLGLRWCTSSDRLAVRVPALPVITTKRQLLSTLCKPFDPLGVLSPWLVTGRALFQKTWTQQPPLGWDEELSPDLRKELTAWCVGADDLDVWFPRTVKISADVTYHVFCDASKLAYCCAIYAVCDGDVRLLIAKSRLAPAAPALSVPRLELMAALIGCRLMDLVRSALDLTEPRVVYWTDAMDVLFWLDQRRTMKVFVQNRVTSILQLTSRDQWRHVRGQDNPADLGTRGLSLSELTVCDVWWRGPDFLRSASAGPPLQLPAVDTDLQPSSDATVELKRERVDKKVSLLARQCEENVPFDVTTCSRLSQAVDRLAWMRRFVYNCRLPTRERMTGPLTPEERKRSLSYWIRAAQHRTYQREIDAVRTDQLLPTGSPLAKLHPQLDDDGVLEATLRTGERPVPILPDLSHITTLIVDEAHRRCFHQGTRVTLAVLTAEYAIQRAADIAGQPVD
ncbi:hypothetical protein FJT64_008179 [Amphibalanus amphitrite]|uniref:Reverse transcriptase domain-containing protein n=1 Tax=Amphibalanus amphitrite TaxID=1232801 RepID=A0A6A4VJE6_AMPAM|nr:hypothetical protein FJT64_008179 [Amphibalanus amphitrite]